MVIENKDLIFDGSRLCNAPFQHFGGEIIAIAQICKTHNEILRFAILNQGNGGYDLDAQALREKRRFLSIDFAKFGFNVLASQNLQVHIDNATTCGRVTIEMTNNIG